MFQHGTPDGHKDQHSDQRGQQNPRILRNCSREMAWEDVVPHLNYFVQRMQFSGYPEETRYKVIKKAIDKYEKEIEATNRTGNRRFIPSIETRKERLVNKATKKKEWSRREGSTNPSCLCKPQKTPNSRTRYRLQQGRTKSK